MIYNREKMNEKKERNFNNPVHLPDCFLNVTNRLVAMEYYEQIQQIIPEETIKLMCEHIKKIIDEYLININILSATNCII